MCNHRMGESRADCREFWTTGESCGDIHKRACPCQRGRVATNDRLFECALVPERSAGLLPVFPPGNEKIFRTQTKCCERLQLVGGPTRRQLVAAVVVVDDL